MSRLEGYIRVKRDGPTHLALVLVIFWPSANSLTRCIPGSASKVLSLKPTQPRNKCSGRGDLPRPFSNEVIMFRKIEVLEITTVAPRESCGGSWVGGQFGEYEFCALVFPLPATNRDYEVRDSKGRPSRIS